MEIGKKIFVLFLGMFLLVGVGAADYKFQNASGVNLVRISGDNGNLTALGNISGSYFFGSGKYLTDLNASSVNYWLKDGNDLYYNDGNVGIGTTSPGYKLHLSGGDFRSEGTFRTGVSGEPGRWRFYDSSGYLMSFWNTGADYDTWGLYWDTNDNEMRWMGSGNLKASVDLDDGSGYFQGNLGIGTTTPQNKLNVIGDGNFTGRIYFNENNLGIVPSGNTLTLQSSGVSTFIASGTTSTIRNPNIINTISLDGTQIVDGSRNLLNLGSITGSGDLTINTDKFYVNATSGRTGIGTTTPQNALNVIGDVNATGNITSQADICLETGECLSSTLSSAGNVSGSGVAGQAAFWTSDDALSSDGNFTWDNVNKRLGIGTTSPVSKLHIAGTPGSLSSGLTFGDGDTGLYEGIDDALIFRVGGNDLWQTQGTSFKAASNSGIRFDSGNPTSTSPNLMPSNADLNTGLGWAGQDQLSLIAGGVEGIRVGSTNVTSNNDVYVSGDLNATGDVCSSGGCLNDVASGNVNANSSDYWDGLDTPADISGSEIDNDLNWINATGAVIAVGNWSADKVNYYTKTETYNQSEVDDMITSGTVNNSEYLDGYDSSFFMPLNTSVSGDFDFNGGWTGGGVSIVDGDVYAQAGYFYQINSLEVSTLEVNGSLIPDLDNSFDVGNSTFGWRDGYFTGQVTADSFVGDGSGLTGLTGTMNSTAWNRSGTDVYLANSGDSVGIGTDSPSAPLQIDGSIARINLFTGGVDRARIGVADTGSQFFSGDAAGDLGIRGEQKVNLGVGNSIDLVIQSGGNVGIGTTTPQNELNVIGDGNFTGTIYGAFIGDGSGITNLNLSGVNGSTQWKDNGNDIYYDLGNVGIGTTSPQQELHVNGSLQLTDNVVSPDSVTFDAETSVGMRLTNPNGYISLTPLNAGWAHIYTDRPRYIFNTDLYVIGGKFASYSTADLTLSAGGVRNDLVIDNVGGNVGINTTTPQNTLNVVGDLNVTGTIYGDSFDGVESNWNVSGSNLYPADLNKDVGIGTDTPTEKLEVSGSAKVTGSMIIGSTNITTEANGDVNVW